MIEKMKMVCIVSSVSKKEEMLKGRRDLGLVHLMEKREIADKATVEKFTALSKTASTLKDYLPAKAKPSEEEILTDETFAKMYEDVQDALTRKAELFRRRN